MPLDGDGVDACREGRRDLAAAMDGHATSRVEEDDDEEAELAGLTRGLKNAQKRGFLVGSQEQGETSSREQIEAQDAIDEFWRRVAATQVDGAGDELRAWHSWRDAGGSRAEVRIKLKAD